MTCHQRSTRHGSTTVSEHERAMPMDKGKRQGDAHIIYMWRMHSDDVS